jgi:N-acylethanolamine-hydrolysing acid amidase
MRWTSVTLAACLALPAVRSDFIPPRVSVDLEASPSHRWTALVTKYNATIHAAVQVMQSDPAFKVLLEAAAILFRTNRSHTGWLREVEYEEIISISRLTNIAPGQLVGMAALYDLTASGTVHSRACTSIVAQGSAAGATPVHGRNLDYPLHEAMRNITMIVDWQRGGRTLFSAVCFLGVVNFNTVVRVGAWSLSQDERDQGFIGDDWVNVFLRRRMLTFSRIRQTAETSATYADAVAALSEADLNAPSYLVLAGAAAGEGAILTRDRSARGGRGADLYPLTSDRWYLVETNYDHWEPPDEKDDRRDPAKRAIGRVGRGVAASPEGMLTVLSDRRCNNSIGERAVLNSHTAYTAVMKPSAMVADASIRVVVRDPARSEQCDAP